MPRRRPEDEESICVLTTPPGPTVNVTPLIVHQPLMVASSVPLQMPPPLPKMALHPPLMARAPPSKSVIDVMAAPLAEYPTTNVARIIKKRLHLFPQCLFISFSFYAFYSNRPTISLSAWSSKSVRRCQ